MAEVKLSILICTIPSRKHFLARLRGILNEQVIPWFEEVEILVDGREDVSIGDKRNALLYRAKGEFCVFCDDDDRVSNHYIPSMMIGIEAGVDCCSLTGIITENSKNPKKFIHSIKYNDWFEKDGIYYRPPNHLNCMRTSIAKRVGFPGKNHGEDKDFSMEMCKQGLLKTEHEISDVIYFYEYISPEVRKQLNYH
jgi:glycosyltransferase involved in cell wall biosynthesis